METLSSLELFDDSDLFKNTRLDHDRRPTCIVPDCTNHAQIMKTNDDGTRRYRRVCDWHHKQQVASKNDKNSYSEVLAKNAGFDSVAEYTSATTGYRKKFYCENIDSRLGYKCTTTIVNMVILDVDHIDGDPSNHNPANKQTLCKCCHAFKTYVNGDHLSPGRKSLGLKR